MISAEEEQRLRDKVANLNERCARLESEIARDKDVVAKARSELEEVAQEKKQHERARGELLRLKNAFAKATADLAALKEELGRARSAVDAEATAARKWKQKWLDAAEAQKKQLSATQQRSDNLAKELETVKEAARQQKERALVLERKANEATQTIAAIRKAVE
jgi:chromosome segregation ATPase